MQVKETILSGCFIIEPRVFKDERGYFFESFNQEGFEKSTGTKVNFVQDNQSFSSYGVVRGLHFQKGAHSQAKLVRVIQGKVLDVAVDIREDSKTYGEHVAVELSAENNKQLFVPRGFAHGFSVLSDTATFIYKCDNYYNKESEGGIIYNDPNLNIDWRLPLKDILVSKNDLVLKTVKEFI